jgi:hypothetical protein
VIDTLHIATYNIHKGFSNFNRRMVVHELRERLRQLGADLVFLQEVQGDHQRHALRPPARPEFAPCGRPPICAARAAAVRAVPCYSRILRKLR